MQIIRFRYGHHGAVYGIVENDHVRPVEGDIFGEYQRLAAALPLSQVKLLTPVTPSKILAMAFNYRSHLGERTPPSQPELFYKPLSCLIGPEEPIVIPRGSERVDAEGELVIVIGRRAKRVPPGDALNYIFGYTCGNDVSARNWQRGDIQWWRAKGADTFGPVGPWLVTDIDPSNIDLQVRINGEVKEQTNTNLLIHDIPHIISYASQSVTLEPGDLIFTGTPGSPPQIRKGDIVEVDINGVGLLRNPVEAEP